jgi:hypothetical protein
MIINHNMSAIFAHRQVNNLMDSDCQNIAPTRMMLPPCSRELMLEAQQFI